MVGKSAPVLELVDGGLPVPVRRPDVGPRTREARKLPDDERPVVLDPWERDERAPCSRERGHRLDLAAPALEDERRGRDRVHCDGFFGAAKNHVLISDTDDNEIWKRLTVLR